MPQSSSEYAPRARYLVVRHQNEWVIKFEGEEFGPYKSQGEAMLFAIDAAQKLGGRTTPPRSWLWVNAARRRPHGSLKEKNDP